MTQSELHALTAISACVTGGNCSGLSLLKSVGLSQGIGGSTSQFFIF